MVFGVTSSITSVVLWHTDVKPRYSSKVVLGVNGTFMTVLIQSVLIYQNKINISKANGLNKLEDAWCDLLLWTKLAHIKTWNSILLTSTYCQGWASCSTVAPKCDRDCILCYKAPRKPIHYLCVLVFSCYNTFFWCYNTFCWCYSR